MCCLFGFVDYAGSLSVKQKTISSENSLSRQKYAAPMPLVSPTTHRVGCKSTSVRWRRIGCICGFLRRLTSSWGIREWRHRAVQRRTITTTPSSAVKGKSFALAHNGIVWNDLEMRRTKHLPRTKVQTDSYVSVQLIEQQKALDFDSLRYMAEQVEGSFTFTVLDEQNALWIVKGTILSALLTFRSLAFTFTHRLPRS